jgi:hypothetical protein
MAIDFPASPTNGQVFIVDNSATLFPGTLAGTGVIPVTGPIYVYDSARGAWKRNSGTALATNKLINPCFQISQQNASNPSGDNVTQFYFADLWRTETAGLTTRMYTTSRCAAVSPRGSQYKSKMLLSNSGTTPVGCYYLIDQLIEGNRVADLQWGTANGKYCVLRFGFSTSYDPVNTGVTVCIRNGAANRSFVQDVVVAANGVANKDFEFSLVIPPDTTGTWPNDNTASMAVGFTIAAGTTYQTANRGIWQAGTFLKSNNSNVGQSTLGGELRIFDVGLYADPNLTGIAPEFVAPHVEDDLQDCMRYWYRLYGAKGVIASATVGYVTGMHPVAMRAAPTSSIVGSLRIHDLSVAPNITSISHHYGDETMFYMGPAASGLTPGRPCQILCDGQTANYIAMSARM